MTAIPKELHDLLAGGHNVWVATVGPDGMPNVSIKGSGALLDDEHLYFADMFSHKTRENLEHDPRVAVGIHDPERKVAMQVKGRAELIDHGEVFDQVNEKLRAISEQLHLPPMKYVVQDHRRVGVGHGPRTARRRSPELTTAATNEDETRGAPRTGAPRVSFMPGRARQTERR